LKNAYLLFHLGPIPGYIEEFKTLTAKIEKFSNELYEDFKLTSDVYQRPVKNKLELAVKSKITKKATATPYIPADQHGMNQWNDAEEAGLEAAPLELGVYDHSGNITILK